MMELSRRICHLKTFGYLCPCEDRMRLGKAKSKTLFSFASALTFLYLCLLKF